MTEKERAREFLIQHRISGADFVYTTGFDNMVGLLEAYVAQQSKMPTEQPEQLTCDTCGRHPSVIVQTPVGRFCMEHAKYF